MSVEHHPEKILLHILHLQHFGGIGIQKDLFVIFFFIVIVGNSSLILPYIFKSFYFFAIAGICLPGVLI